MVFLCSGEGKREKMVWLVASPLLVKGFPIAIYRVSHLPRETKGKSSTLSICQKPPLSPCVRRYHQRKKGRNKTDPKNPKKISYPLLCSTLPPNTLWAGFSFLRGALFNFRGLDWSRRRWIARFLLLSHKKRKIFPLPSNPLPSNRKFFSLPSTATTIFGRWRVGFQNVGQAADTHFPKKYEKEILVT